MIVVRGSTLSRGIGAAHDKKQCGLDLRVDFKVYRHRVSTFRISQLAEQAGLPATTLRFYEQAGLLPAQRSAAGYRLYDDAALDRLAFIGAAKHLGLPLEEIRELLAVWEQGVCADVRAQLLPLVAGRITEADQRIAELSAFVDRLACVHDELSGPAPEGGCGPGCGCVRTPETRPAPIELLRPRPASSAESVPVACTLSAGDQRARAGQWHEVLARADRRDAIDGGVRVALPISLAATVADLAAAEQQCCPFLTFTLTFTGSALELTVRAPEAAAGLLAELFGLPA